MNEMKNKEEDDEEESECIKKNIGKKEEREFKRKNNL